MDKISFVVPVYNVEKYIVRCIQSLVRQTYSNIEIILVNDGSTDKSGFLCEKMYATDNRVIVINQENGGLSAARNTGIQYASGDYIILVDGDDYIHPQMAEILHDVAVTSDSDIVSCQMQLIEEDDIPDKIIFDTYMRKCAYVSMTHPDIYKQLWERNIDTVVQCNKLFRADVIKSCSYPIGKYHEDVFIIHEILSKCHRIAYIQPKLYYYVQRQGSIMHLETRQMMLDALSAYSRRQCFFEERNLYAEAKHTSKTTLEYLLWRGKEMIRKHNFSDWEWLISTYREEYRIKAHYYGKSIELWAFYWFPNYYKKYYEVRSKTRL